MKKFISAVLILASLLLLTSCKYVSSYKAIGLVKKQSSHSCEASFYSLKGQLVFKLKNASDGTEGNISYSIRVDEGELHIYYDSCGVKEELVHAKAGETIEDISGYAADGKNVYIIIEAPEKTGGKVTVEIEH